MAGIQTKLGRQVHIAPLVVFRIVFGLMMLGAIIRFAAYGWIKTLYIDPDFYFPYLGFEWIKPLGNPGMYIVFFIIGLSALMIALGLFYRVFAALFFVLFTYVELIDKTPYLNHYYFICLVSFLLIFMPAHRYFSLDVYFRRVRPLTQVAAWLPGTLKLQLGLVYFFAGLAKLHPDWLLQALPLKIWLPARADMPLLGPLLVHEWVAYAFSWIGMLFDLFIPFILLSARFRLAGYMLVVVFHLLTWFLFNIGMFPFVMIGCTLVFFSHTFHLRVIGFVSGLLRIKPLEPYTTSPANARRTHAALRYFLVLYFTVQLLVPMRYMLYPGNLFWTEEGFRFSWRVMLMEKSGFCTFYVCQDDKAHCVEINNSQYLSRFQEKMMSTQPDMILQFARFIYAQYRGKTIRVGNHAFTFTNPRVYVDAYVNLNGRGSRPFIDPAINLAAIQPSLAHKTWVLPYTE